MRPGDCRELTAAFRGWRYAIPGSRDYRLDLIRGFLVLAMIVDHLGGASPLTALTGDNRFLTSAAEGFIFISGLLMGVVYGGRVKRLGLAAGVRAAHARAIFLYATFVGLTLAFVALYLFTSVPLWMDRAGGLGVDTPIEALVGTLTLHYSYHGTDIILIYVILVAASPIAFHLLAKGRWPYLVGGSWLLWATYQFFPEAVFLPFPDTREPVFALAAWQLLFYNGLAIGYHRDQLGAVTRALERPAVTAALAAATLGLILFAQAQHAGQLAALGVPGLNDDTFAVLFGKPSLGLGRVLAFVVVAALARQIATFAWVPVERYLGWLLVPLGQKALFAYGFHLFLLGPFIATFGVAMWVDPASPLLNALIQAALVGIVYVAIRLHADSRLGAVLAALRRLETSLAARRFTFVRERACRPVADEIGARSRLVTGRRGACPHAY